MPIIVRIDVEPARRRMSVGEFAERLGLTPANIAVLKNGRAKAVRSSTLEAVCRVLECRPGDLLEWVEDRTTLPPRRPRRGRAAQHREEQPLRPTKGPPVKYILPLLVIAVGVVVGVAGIVYGEADDSPGLQLLGVLLVLAALVFGVRSVRRHS